MQTNEAIPGAKERKPVKEIIISILSREWPLTSKRIYNRVKKEGASVTYQAVHKAIKELAENKTLLKEGMEYSINPAWISQNKSYYEELEKTIVRGERVNISRILDNKITELEFNNVFDFYSFLLDILEVIVEKSENKTGAAEYHNMYWALSGSKKEQEQFEKCLLEYPESYVLCRGDTFGDRMLARYYEHLGAKVKTGVECAKNNDIVALGDYVIQIFLEKKLKDEVSMIYSTLSESMQDINKIYDQLFRAKTRITVIVKKDPELAKEIIESVIKQFEGT